MKYLAHRGDWTLPDERNSRAAIRRAFDGGHGIETDLRDHDGTIVISHDPPTGRDLFTFDDLLQLYVDTGRRNTLALNVKSDGLQESVRFLLEKYNAEDYFVFDMAVPDALGYLARDMKSFTRISEYEKNPSFLDKAQGIWADAFISDWMSIDTIENYLKIGYDVSLVSPELHGRPHREVWEKWKNIQYYDGSSLYICTDFPNEAKSFFD